MRLNDWKMKPILWSLSFVSSRSESARVSRPSILTAPDVGVSTHPIRLSSVVLPLPDGPATERNSPRPT